ncbi:MAG TPA: hypothetical protein VJU02_04880 [Nitrospiraceae bacterium]|nr:hypothetical protein [Nitrospiraceae bacterium]
MPRLICILTLALLCLPAVTQATPLALTDMSKATLTLGPGTENGQVRGFLSDSHSGVRVGDQNIGKFSPHVSAAMSDELGRRGGEASPDNGHLSSSAFTESADLYSGIRPTIKGGASVHKSFLVSGEGHGVMTFSAPITQDITRSIAMVVDRQGASLPIDNGLAAVSLFKANDPLREQHAALTFGANDGSRLLRTQAGPLSRSEFLNLTRTLGDFGAGVVVATDVGAVSLPEPSSMIFLSCALLALVIFPRRYDDTAIVT